MSDGGVNIKVVVRCKPSPDSSDSFIIKPNASEISVLDRRKFNPTDNSQRSYKFDGVCSGETRQEALFEDHVVPLVEEALQGFNCTIFAYGHTGTGKTYTMEGDWVNTTVARKSLDSSLPPITPQSCSSFDARAANHGGGCGGKAPLSLLQPNGGAAGAGATTAEQIHYNTPITYFQQDFSLPSGVGIIPRAISLIFKKLSMLAHESALKVSFLEIYNEELVDLLQTGEKLSLKIFENSAKQITAANKAIKGLAVKNLIELPVSSLPEVYGILNRAAKKRRTAETSMNRQSSRSHSIFTITVTIKEITMDGDDMIRIGKLNLVDLAGSENIQRSGTQSNHMRTKEAGLINQSLVALGRVINALVNTSSPRVAGGTHAAAPLASTSLDLQNQYVPYRDSKLTRLLQDSLGGHTKTCIIATVSLEKTFIEETMSTLDYVQRAKHIRNKPVVNEKMSQKFVMKELTVELEKLRKELKIAREKSGDVYLTNDVYEEVQADLVEYERLQDQHRKLVADHESMGSLVSELQGTLVDYNDLKEDHVRVQQELGVSLEEVAALEAHKREISHALEVESALKRDLMHTCANLENVYQAETRLTTAAHQLCLAQKMRETNLTQTCNNLAALTRTIHDHTHQTVRQLLWHQQSQLMDTVLPRLREISQLVESEYQDLSRFADLTRSSTAHLPRDSTTTTTTTATATITTAGGGAPPFSSPGSQSPSLILHSSPDSSPLGSSPLGSVSSDYGDENQEFSNVHRQKRRNSSEPQPHPRPRFREALKYADLSLDAYTQMRETNERALKELGEHSTHVLQKVKENYHREMGLVEHQMQREIDGGFDRVRMGVQHLHQSTLKKSEASVITESAEEILRCTGQRNLRRQLDIEDVERLLDEKLSAVKLAVLDKLGDHETNDEKFLKTQVERPLHSIIEVFTAHQAELNSCAASIDASLAEQRQKCDDRQQAMEEGAHRIFSALEDLERGVRSSIGTWLHRLNAGSVTYVRDVYEKTKESLVSAFTRNQSLWAAVFALISGQNKHSVRFHVLSTISCLRDHKNNAMTQSEQGASDLETQLSNIVPPVPLHIPQEKQAFRELVLVETYQDADMQAAEMQPAVLV